MFFRLLLYEQTVETPYIPMIPTDLPLSYKRIQIPNAFLIVPLASNRLAPYFTLRVQNSETTETVGCGSDFKTYKSESSFLAAKKKNPSIKILHGGNCKKVCQTDKPICATNNKTYRNICHLNLERAEQLDLFAVHSGPCRLRLSSFIKNRTAAWNKKSRISYSYYDDSVSSNTNYDEWLLHG